MIIFRIAVLALLLAAGPLANGAEAESETLYIRAQASVPLLSAPAPEAAITGRLTPGDAVTVLGRDAGYVQIQAASGAQGWLSQSDVTATVPAAVRIEGLEQEAASLRQQLATAQAELRSAQSALRQARQSAETARDVGQGHAAELEARTGELEAALATRDTRLRELEEQIAEMEMAQQASRLLSSQAAPATNPVDRYSLPQLGIFAAAGLLLGVVGLWTGSRLSLRRIRRRYHGLQL